MKDILVRGNCWENPPIPALREEDFQDDECDDDHLEPGGQIDVFLYNELQCTHTSEEVKASIVKLSNEKMISNDIKTGLLNLHDETFKRLPTSLPMFQKIEKEVRRKTHKLSSNIIKWLKSTKKGRSFISTRLLQYGYCRNRNVCRQIVCFVFKQNSLI